MKNIFTSALLLIIFTFGLGVVYPVAVWGISQVLFPYQANGSLIEKDGKIIGSELIGQQFESEKYFHSRLSQNNYDGANSGGSNLAPTNKKLIERINEQTENNIPLDLMTTSASGLDPHISPESAFFQIPRIAKSRNLSEEKVSQIILQNIENRQFYLLGEPRLNVLNLNLELDKLK